MNDNYVPINYENGHVEELDGVAFPSTTVSSSPIVPPSPILPLASTVQGASSTKKTSAIRGCKREDMMVVIDNVEF